MWWSAFDRPKKLLCAAAAASTVIAASTAAAAAASVQIQINNGMIDNHAFSIMKQVTFDKCFRLLNRW